MPKHLYLLNSELYCPFGAQLIWNRIKIYMGAISKSEPISIKFGKDISELYLIYFPEYRCYVEHITAVGNKYDNRMNSIYGSYSYIWTDLHQIWHTSF